MGLAVRRLHAEFEGRTKVTYLSVDFDSSYPTGGELFDPQALADLSRVDVFQAENRKGYTFELDRLNKKLLAYVSGGTEVTDTADLSTLTDCRFVLRGR